jgi:hypothetical protein
MKASPIVLLLLLACASAPAHPDPTPAPLPGCGEAGGEGEDVVVGGVSGGRLQPGQSVFLPPNVGRAQISVDLKDPRYRPQIPPEHARPGATYVALFKICVSDAGQVTSVSTLKSTCVAQIDDAWTATIETWSHRPYEVDGSRHPFCYPMRLQRRTPKLANEPASGGSSTP